MPTKGLSTEFVEITCHRCLIPYGMSIDFWRVKKADHETFYCPLGHGAHYPEGKTEAEKLREQLERERGWRTSVEAALDQEKASHSSTKGQLTKAKKRAANGVCPCCNRTFANVARHVANQHPDHVTEVNGREPTKETHPKREAKVDG